MLVLVLGALSVSAGRADAQAEDQVTVVKRFDYTGGEQRFTVPQGVTSLRVEAVGGWGADGGRGQLFNGTRSEGGAGGRAGYVDAEIPVTPGQVLFVAVGGTGSGDWGGWNGGGDGGWLHAGATGGYGGGGGGASDVRTCSRTSSACATASDSLRSRLIVAAGSGGGGGGGGSGFLAPGGGGGLRDGSSSSADGGPDSGSSGATGGRAGTLQAGGAAGSGCAGRAASDGTLGAGGYGAPVEEGLCQGPGGGGGGGGGLYGGGGGGKGYTNKGGGGGGAGSSFVVDTATSRYVDYAPGREAPHVRFTYLLTPGPASNLKVGAAQPASIPANGVSTSKVTATVTDANDLPLSGQDVRVSSSDPGQKVGPVQDNGDGTYVATITSSTKAGNSTITVTDTSVTGLSGTTTLTQTALAASKVDLKLLPESMPADGTSTTTATATVADVNGNPVKGDRVSFASSDPGQRIGATKNNGDGTYAATITSSTNAGGATITATDTSVNPAVSATATLTQTPLPPQCDDGKDNDGDGKTDFGGQNPDPGCQDPSDNSEDSDKMFTVDTTADGRDVGPGDGRCNAGVPAGSPCTLRAAVMEANTSDAPDTVILPAGRYDLAAANRSLEVSGRLTLTGAGARSTTISGGEGFAHPVLFMGYGTTAQVSGVTITGGNAQDWILSGGGGVYNLGKLTLRESAVVGNNAADLGGGGIYSEGPLEILASTVAGNTTPQGAGGGVFQNNAPITVANSTISGNTAPGAGGGLVVGEPNGVLKMTNSTVVSNASAAVGGGVLTFSSARATIENSIIWGNTSNDCDSATYGGGATTSTGGNLSGDASCGFTGADDEQNADPLLGPLRDNGGPTDTRALPGGSPAVDAGLASSCPAADQRGVARPQEGDGAGAASCDAGAYELRPGGIVALDPAAQSVNEAAGTATVTVRRVAGSEGGTIGYATADGTGDAGAKAGSDYGAWGGTFEFGAGESSKTVTIPITQDDVDEGEAETLTVTLGDPSSGFVIAAGGNRAEVSIADDDASKLGVDDVTLPEGDAGQKDASFTATLSTPNSRPVTTDYATLDGTASAPSDYEARDGTVTFDPGQTSKAVVVRISGDTKDEPDETFHLGFSHIQNAAIEDGRGDGVIQDDDTNGVPTANDDSYQTPHDQTLRVPAPGPLANDADPEDDALSAVMVSDVSHGALALSADGSFTYTPAAGFVGRDAFTYKATDGASSSGVATVEILVKDAKPTVKGVAPTGRKVPRAANVTATFSEAMDAHTISTQTVNLSKKGARSPVQATVSYDPAAMKATLDPAKPLVKGATYTATVSTGVQDTAGNALAATKSWRFTVKS